MLRLLRLRKKLPRSALIRGHQAAATLTPPSPSLSPLPPGSKVALGQAQTAAGGAGGVHRAAAARRLLGQAQTAAAAAGGLHRAATARRPQLPATMGRFQGRQRRGRRGRLGPGKSRSSLSCCRRQREIGRRRAAITLFLLLIQLDEKEKQEKELMRQWTRPPLDW